MSIWGNPVMMGGSGGGGGSIIFGTSAPASAIGDNGDTYCEYHSDILVVVKVDGGYNGGAVITVTADGDQVFTTSASDVYNLNYGQTYAEVQTSIGTVTIQVTPPSSQAGELYITVTGPQNSFTSNPPKQGANTSYGYGNYSNSGNLTGSGSSRIADAFYIKQSGTWKGVGDVV